MEQQNFGGDFQDFALYRRLFVFLEWTEKWTVFALKVYHSDSYCSDSDSEGIFSCGLHSFVVVVFAKKQTEKKVIQSSCLD